MVQGLQNALWLSRNPNLRPTQGSNHCTTWLLNKHQLPSCLIPKQDMVLLNQHPHTGKPPSSEKAVAGTAGKNSLALSLCLSFSRPEGSLWGSPAHASRAMCSSSREAGQETCNFLLNSSQTLSQSLARII